MKDATGTTPEEWALWRAFLVGHAGVLRRIDGQLQRDADLAQGEYAAITAILDSPHHRLRIGRIADALGWEKSRASHLVARMERRGLVEREPCADDARATDIVVSAEGRRRQLGAMRGHAAEMRRVFLDRIEPAERAVVAAALARIISGLEQSDRSSTSLDADG